MIAVLGSGAFGTALAISLAANGPITLWARDRAAADEMQKTRQNVRRLPGAGFPDQLCVAHDPAGLEAADTILLATPMQTLRDVLQTRAGQLNGKRLVACCKGVELSTLKSPTEIIAECVAAPPPAVLTGPSFAHDIARGLPTALTLACADDALGRSLQAALNTANLRLYRSTDTVGAELGGALKNVIAIACGAAIGAGLGESARAALMTRGYAEMQRIALRLGARPETLAGLSGFGDLALTCCSDQSRNTRFGLSLGRGEVFDTKTTVEGAATARAVAKRAATLDIDMPITDVVVALIDGKLRVDTAMDMLLSRPLKEEQC